MVEIDIAHAKLVEGLVVSFKPQNILEFGYGGGRAHNAICQGARYNINKPNYTLVDNWHDWNFQCPEAVHNSVLRHSLNHKHHEARENTFNQYTVVTSDERSFVYDTTKHYNGFDFIMSDADHQHSHEWANVVYDNMLASPGILVYHDVDGSYPGLGELPAKFNQTGFVFNRSTRDEEECKRGLLVIFKR